jgi:hypothetical protein
LVGAGVLVGRGVCDGGIGEGVHATVGVQPAVDVGITVVPGKGVFVGVADAGVSPGINVGVPVCGSPVTVPVGVAVMVTVPDNVGVGLSRSVGARSGAISVVSRDEVGVGRSKIAAVLADGGVADGRAVAGSDGVFVLVGSSSEEPSPPAISTPAITAATMITPKAAMPPIAHLGSRERVGGVSGSGSGSGCSTIAVISAVGAG